MVLFRVQATSQAGVHAAGGPALRGCLTGSPELISAYRGGVARHPRWPDRCELLRQPASALGCRVPAAAARPGPWRAAEPAASHTPPGDHRCRRRTTDPRPTAAGLTAG